MPSPLGRTRTAWHLDERCVTAPGLSMQSRNNSNHPYASARHAPKPPPDSALTFRVVHVPELVLVDATMTRVNWKMTPFDAAENRSRRGLSRLSSEADTSKIPFVAAAALRRCRLPTPPTPSSVYPCASRPSRATPCMPSFRWQALHPGPPCLIFQMSAETGPNGPNSSQIRPRLNVSTASQVLLPLRNRGIAILIGAM